MTSPTTIKTYADRLFRVNVVASTPGEIIVNTVWCQTDFGAVGPPTTQAVADKVRDEWTKMLTVGYGVDAPALKALFSNGTVWRTCTAYKVDGLGKAVEQAEAPFAAGAAGAATSALPAQCSLVVSLLTNLPGRSGRGRLFLGGLAQAVISTDGRVTAPQAQQVANTMAGMYIGIRDELGGDDYRPVVVSPTTGAANKITRLQVGNLIDTMRSRRGKLIEARSAAVVDAS